MIRGRRGSLLIGIMFCLLLLSLMALTGASMLANQSRTAVNVQVMAEAHAAVVMGMTYLERQLAAESPANANVNWKTLTSFNPVTLGSATVTGVYTATERNRVDVEMTADVERGQSSANKKYRFSIFRLPRAFYYSLFRGNSGADSDVLRLGGIVIGGNVYSNGDAEALSGTQIQGGTFYRKGEFTDNSGESIREREVEDPQPQMPSYDRDMQRNSYEAAAAEYDADIAAIPEGTPDLEINDYVQLTGETVYAQNVTVSGEVVITGQGKIVAAGDIRFQQAFPGECLRNDAAFRSSNGGCKSLQANRVAGEVKPDANHTAAVDACADLSEGGYGAGAWELPTESQLQQLAAAGLASHLAGAAGTVWSATESGIGSYQAVDLTNGVSTTANELTELPFLCTRAAETTSSGTTTVFPSGGDIIFAAGGRIIESDDARTLYVNADLPSGPRAVFYSAGNNSVNDQLFLGGPENLLNRPLLIANRNLTIGQETQMANGAVLYVRDLSDIPADNNYMDIIGTPNMSTYIQGSLLSVSRREPNLTIRSGAFIQGIVYSNGDAESGSLQLSNSVVFGSVVANRLLGDVSGMLMRLDPEYYPSEIPDGFAGSASRVAGSWKEVVE